MYEFDYYKRKTYATEPIVEGTSIGVPFKSMRGSYYISPNNRLGEFLNEGTHHSNCQLIATPGINMTVFYILEATENINPGDELLVSIDHRQFNLKNLQKEYMGQYKYAIEGTGYRMDNMSDIMVAYEHLDQCTDFRDKIQLIQCIKENAEKYDLKLDFSLNESADNNIKLYTEAAVSPKRKKIENHLLTVFNKLDKTGKNSKFYKDVFSKMSDEQFMDYIKKVVYNEDECFFLEILPYDNEPTLKDIKECLDYMKVPLDEYLYMRYEEDPDNPVRTRYKVPVGLM